MVTGYLGTKSVFLTIVRCNLLHEICLFFSVKIFRMYLYFYVNLFSSRKGKYNLSVILKRIGKILYCFNCSILSKSISVSLQVLLLPLPFFRVSSGQLTICSVGP